MNNITTRRVRAGQPPACGIGPGCKGSKACADHDCENHPINTDLMGLPVIDATFLDEQIQRVDLPIEMIEPVPAYSPRSIALVLAVLLVLACTFYVSTL